MLKAHKDTQKFSRFFYIFKEFALKWAVIGFLSSDIKEEQNTHTFFM